MKKTLLSTAIIALATVPLKAATLVHNVQSLNSLTQVSSEGTSILSLNLGKNENLDLNGVTFSGNTSGRAFHSGVSLSMFPPFGNVDGSISDLYQGPLSGNMNAFLDTAGFVNGATGGSRVDFSGLTIGKRYQLQMFFVDDRTNGFAHILNGSTINTPANMNGFRIGSSSSGTHAKIVTTEFIADRTTENLFVTRSDVAEQNQPSSMWGGLMNGLQLRELPATAPTSVPEPSSFMLASLGAVSMVLRRRRRNS